MNHRFGIEPPDDGWGKLGPDATCDGCGHDALTRLVELRSGGYAFLCVACQAREDRLRLLDEHEAAKPRQGELADALNHAP